MVAAVWVFWMRHSLWSSALCEAAWWLAGQNHFVPRLLSTVNSLCMLISIVCELIVGLVRHWWRHFSVTADALSCIMLMKIAIYDLCYIIQSLQFITSSAPGVCWRTEKPCHCRYQHERAFFSLPLSALCHCDWGQSNHQHSLFRWVNFGNCEWEKDLCSRKASRQIKVDHNDTCCFVVSFSQRKSWGSTSNGWEGSAWCHDSDNMHRMKNALMQITFTRLFF